MNKQQKWNSTYIKMTSFLASNSKCAAKQVACILVKDNNIISIGLNGTLPGKDNCNDLFFKNGDKWYKKINNFEKNGKSVKETLLSIPSDTHYKWSLVNEVHAEINAIANANKNGVSVCGSDAYITHSPCFNCAKTLAAFGVKNIFYIHEYDDINTVSEYLSDNSINLEKISL